MSAIRKPKHDRDVIAEAAKAAYDNAGGDLKKSVVGLEAMVRKDRGLRDALTEPLIAQACYDAVRRACHTDRKSVWKEPTERLVKGRTTGSARVVHLAAGNLMMFPLPGGKKLGEATRGEIGEAATFYEKQAGDMTVKARWLRLVAQSIPSGKTARDALTDKRLRELQVEAKRG